MICLCEQRGFIYNFVFFYDVDIYIFIDLSRLTVMRDCACSVPNPFRIPLDAAILIGRNVIERMKPDLQRRQFALVVVADQLIERGFIVHILDPARNLG